MTIGVRSSALTAQEVAELKARHLACSHLIKGSQDAIIRLRNQTSNAPKGADLRTANRATEILEEVVGSWCETLSILRSALSRTTPLDSLLPQRSDLVQSVFDHASRLPSVNAPEARRS
jgi:hypothetical protein